MSLFRKNAILKKRKKLKNNKNQKKQIRKRSVNFWLALFFFVFLGSDFSVMFFQIRLCLAQGTNSMKVEAHPVEAHPVGTLAARPKIKVYAYSSFVASWGAGPKLVRRFQEKYPCEIELVEGGSSGLLVQRLLLESDSPRADVVLGIDQFSIKSAKTMKWLPMEKIRNSIRWSSELKKLRDEKIWGSFVPFDWSPLTLIGKVEGAKEPGVINGEIQSLQDLVQPRFEKSIVAQDPRNSVLGVYWLTWPFALWDQKKSEEFLNQMKTKIALWAPSWSAGYGYFKKGNSQWVFSYLTSPIYHWKEEKDFRYRPVVFEHAHPYQVEFAGIPASCQQCQWAEKFVQFLLEPENQALMCETNYMFPVVEGVVLDPLFSKLPKLPLLKSSYYGNFQDQQDNFVEKWKKIYF